MTGHEARPRGLLVDLDGSAYAYAPCHAAGLDAAEVVGAAAGWPERAAFRADFVAAREAVKAHTHGQAASHCRLLYLKRMVERRHGRSDLRLTMALHDAYWAGYERALVAAPGCLEALTAARDAGIKLAWVSNYTTERQVRKLAAIGLLDACDFLVTSEEAGAEKPAAAPYALALGKLGLGAAEVWMVGDSLADDVYGALQHGIRGIWLRPADAQALADGAVTVIEGWAGLPALLGLVAHG